MTSIEKKLMKQESKKFKIMELISRKIADYEELVKERSKDHYFADSWEQSMQIRKDIEKIQDNIIFLQHMFQNLFFETKITISECTRLKTLCR